MAQQWGLTQDQVGEETAGPKRRGLKLPPAQARAAHKGIISIHASAIAVWVFVSLLLGALMLAGKAVPPAVLLAGIGAAAGHGLFILTHLYFAAAAKKQLLA
jgi:hypothetical protein